MNSYYESIVSISISFWAQIEKVLRKSKPPALVDFRVSFDRSQVIITYRKSPPTLIQSLNIWAILSHQKAASPYSPNDVTTALKQLNERPQPFDQSSSSLIDNIQTNLKTNPRLPTHTTYLLSLSSTRTHISKWLEQNKPQESPPEERPQESNLLPRLPESPPQPLEESRSHTDTVQVPSLSERSEDTKSPPSFWSESFHSKDLSERSPKTSRPTLDSKDLPSLPFKRLLRPTLSVFSRILTCAPSTPRESPSCQRTSNWPEESEERDHKRSIVWAWGWVL